MKYLFTIISIFIVSIMLNTAIIANNIGYLDTEIIFQKAKFAQQFRENFSEKEKEFKELIEKKSKKIEEAVAKGKDHEKIQEMVKKRDEELMPKRQELQNFELSFRQNFLLNVSTTAKKVAEDLGISVVVDKQIVYYGGTDLTDMVLDQLNK